MINSDFGDLPRADASAPAHLVPIKDLLPADSPRLTGENPDHVRLLAEIETELPPIMVDRRTRRVIDGTHRLSAAKLRGDASIKVRFFTGTPEDAFIVGVRENVTHGLPLSRADREAAVIRIATAQPAWSDRAIATVAGLSAKTVKRLRQHATADGPQLHTRIGRDGRVRPLDAAQSRRRIGEVIAARPGASLREIARIAGASPATVRSVRERMMHDRTAAEAAAPGAALEAVAAGAGDHPGERRPRGDAGRVSRLPQRPAEPVHSVEELRAHPALGSEAGQDLLRWLYDCNRSLQDADAVVSAVPPHCAYILARIARGLAEDYAGLADRLEEPAAATADHTFSTR